MTLPLDVDLEPGREVAKRRACETCAWWVCRNYTGKGYEHLGQCHRYAPREQCTQGYVWPHTAGADFCGEHAFPTDEPPGAGEP